MRGVRPRNMQDFRVHSEVYSGVSRFWRMFCHCGDGVLRLGCVAFRVLKRFRGLYLMWSCRLEEVFLHEGCCRVAWLNVEAFFRIFLFKGCVGQVWERWAQVWRRYYRFARVL